MDGVFFTNDGLLVSNKNEDLVDIVEADGDLDGHQGEVYLVSLIKNFAHRHIRVELEAYIEGRQYDLNTYIDDKHYSYHHPFALVDFRGFSHSQFSKPLSTVAKTESLVDLANFVKLCLINYSLELHFLSRVNILAMLVDIVAPGLAVGDEFLGELLILTISNDLLGNIQNTSHKCQSIVARFSLKHQSEAVLNHQVHVLLPLSEIAEDTNSDENLHQSITIRIPFWHVRYNNEIDRIYHKAQYESHTPLKQWNLAFCAIGLGKFDISTQFVNEIGCYRNCASIAKGCHNL